MHLIFDGLLHQELRIVLDEILGRLSVLSHQLLGPFLLHHFEILPHVINDQDDGVLHHSDPVRPQTVLHL